MISLETTNKLPKNLYYCSLFKIAVVMFLISLFGGMANNAILPTFLAFMIVIGGPIFFYIALTYKYISFIVDKTKILINSGIIFKKSIAIPFDRVQNVDCNKGPILGLFGLSKINIWTASPNQISIQGKNSSTNPDGVLIIQTEDAKWLQDFILNKGIN